MHARQNLAPGAADRLGLSSAVLRKKYPSLITVDISGYGQRGPKKNYKAYDLLVCGSHDLRGRCIMSSWVGACLSLIHI